MLTVSLLTALFVVSLVAVVVPSRSVKDGTERAIYCVWTIPTIGLVQAIAVYFLYYRHFRPLYYRSERSVSESVTAMADEALFEARGNSQTPGTMANSVARTPQRSPFNTSLYVDAAKLAERASGTLSLEEANRLRRSWRHHSREDAHLEPTRGVLSDVAGLRKALNGALNTLQRLEIKRASARAAEVNKAEGMAAS